MCEFGFDFFSWVRKKVGLFDIQGVFPLLYFLLPILEAYVTGKGNFLAGNKNLVEGRCAENNDRYPDCLQYVESYCSKRLITEINSDLKLYCLLQTFTAPECIFPSCRIFMWGYPLLYFIWYQWQIITYHSQDRVHEKSNIYILHPIVSGVGMALSYSNQVES